MRQPKPFFRKQTKSWYVQLGKHQINLGRNKQKAWAKYHELMTENQEFDFYSATVAQLLDAYLDWLQKRRAASTYGNAQRFAASFIASVGKRLKIQQLKPHQLTKWLDPTSIQLGHQTRTY